jgi:uncharacterized protein with HEPN domain
MLPEIKTWLYDILNAIQEIENFAPEDFIQYQNDLKTRRAIERNIEIIGEAVNRVVKKDSAIQVTDAINIIDTRNRIIHGYDTVSDETIWSIVINNLPVLKSEIEALLGE